MFAGDRNKIRKLRISASGIGNNFEKTRMKTTDEMRAERGKKMDFAAPSGTSADWLTDANGDLVETDAEEEDGTSNAELPTPNAAEASMLEVRRALSADLQPLGEALAGALQAGDGPAFSAALKKISARMPEFLNSPALEDLLASEFVKALTEPES
jgi:hypothetical protein